MESNWNTCFSNDLFESLEEKESQLLFASFRKFQETFFAAANMKLGAACFLSKCVNTFKNSYFRTSQGAISAFVGIVSESLYKISFKNSFMTSRTNNGQTVKDDLSNWVKLTIYEEVPYPANPKHVFGCGMVAKMKTIWIFIRRDFVTTQE